MIVDLLERINLLLEGIFRDAKNTGNVVIFDYDFSYPRVFENDPHHIIKALEYMAKFLLFNQKNSRILMSFKLTNYSTDFVIFDMILTPSKPIESGFDEKYLNLARKDMSRLYSKIDILKDRIKTSVKLKNAKSISHLSHTVLNLEKFKKYHAVISYPDDKGFEILHRQLTQLGINVRPTSDFLNAYTHIINPIYTPNLVFIHKDDIISSKDKAEILRAKSIKNFGIVIICEKDDVLYEEDENDFMVLRQPYTYDILTAILTFTYSRSLKQDF